MTIRLCDSTRMLSHATHCFHLADLGCLIVHSVSMIASPECVD